MSEPIVFISRNRIKPDMLAEFTRHYQTSIPLAEANKPDTLVQLAFVSVDESEVAIVRVFASAEAMDEQLRGSDVRSKAAYQFIEPTRMEIYGTPSSYSMEMIEKVAGQGISVSILPAYIGGFIHLEKVASDGS
jgi:hypothetical protein